MHKDKRVFITVACNNDERIIYLLNWSVKWATDVLPCRVFSFNTSPSPPSSSTKTKSFHFSPLQSIHLGAQSPAPHLPSPCLAFVCLFIYLFLAHCSLWFSSVTDDGVKMMDVYLPRVRAVRLFLTAHQHHHHRRVLHKACSSSLIKSVTKSPLSRSLRRYRCLLTGASR